MKQLMLALVVVCTLMCSQLFTEGAVPGRRSVKPRVIRLARTSWPVSRILYTGRLAASRPAVIHLGLPSPAGSSGLPAGIGRATLNRLRSAPEAARLLALLQVGFTEPSRSPGMLVVSYTTVSPLPRPRRSHGARRFVFCGTVPRVTPGCR